MLAFLAMSPGRARTRDSIAGTFWPNLSDSQARRCLSKALWQIHSAVGPALDTPKRLIRTAGDTVCLSPDVNVWADADEFRRALEQVRPSTGLDHLAETERLEYAVSLYRGDFLEGYYEDWLLPEREHLRQRFLAALRRLSDLSMSRGDYETALSHARTLTRHEPLAEDAHQRVMRLAVLLGRHNEAVLQYRFCRRALRDQLGVDPSEQTRAVYDAATRARRSPRSDPDPSIEVAVTASLTEPHFVGRGPERSALVQGADAVLAGMGRVALVEGEAGMGKTRMLWEVAADARWRGLDVLWGRCLHGGSRPYGPLAEALAAGLTPLRIGQLSEQLELIWIRQLARIVPALAQSGRRYGNEAPALRPSEEQERMMEAITLAFTALADLTPLMVVLDDVHWADGDTARALAHLVAGIEGHRLLLVLAYRPTEVRKSSHIWDLVRYLDQHPSCRRISLQGCSFSETEALVRGCLSLSSISTDLVRQVHRETDGIPLLVIELLQEYRGSMGPEGADRGGHVNSEIPASSLGSRIHSLVRNRILDLPEEARAVLELLAVHDGQLTHSELCSASDLGQDTVQRAVLVLRERQLIAGDPDASTLTHGLLRRVVYGDQTPSGRRRLHKRVGLAVEAHRPDEVELLAHHFRTAQLPGRAAGYLEKAAERAIAAAAYDSAAQYLASATQALEEAGASREERFRVTSRYEEVLDTLARRSEQEKALACMDLFASGSQVIDVSRRRAWWFANQDRFVEADAEARHSLDMARDAADGGRVVAALSTLGMIACIRGRAAEGLSHLEAATAHRVADLHQQADARNALGQNLLDLQRFDEAEPQLLAALALYSELRDPRGEAEVLGMLGTLRMERGEPTLAEQALLRALEVSRRIGYRHGEAVYRMNLGILHALENRLQSAFRQFAESAQIYDLMGYKRGRALVLSNSAWLRHAVLGQDVLAERDALIALDAYRELGDTRGQAQCLGTLASLACRRGSHAKGQRLFDQSLRLARDACDSWIQAQILKERARCDLEAGRPDEGLAHAERAYELSSKLGMRDMSAALSALRGRFQVELGRLDEALAATTEAVGGGQPQTALVPSVAYAHGLALAASGQRTKADSFLELAYQAVMDSLRELPEEERLTALAAVPAHSEIVAAWSQRRPLRQQRWVARVGAPRGRPVTTDGQVGITWTIHSPDDLCFAKVQDRRRQRLLRLLEEATAQGACPTVAELAEALTTSVATVRRDLKALRDRGKEVATRGRRQPRLSGQVIASNEGPESKGIMPA